MTKAEFLETLRSKLMGEVADYEIENTIRYYDDYITAAMQEGKSEEEVLQELGSPLLIARTIIDTSASEDRSQKVVYNDNASEDRENRQEFKHFQLNGWVMFGIFLLILFVLFTIFRILLPILVPVLLMVIIFSIFRNGRR